MRTLLKTLLLVSLAFLSAGCMTQTVLHDVRYPKPTDNAPWANYILLPITVPLDIATSPIQIPGYISYAKHHHPRQRIVPIETTTKE